jgi:molybdopterin biosynthesis enzyme MoaB
MDIRTSILTISDRTYNKETIDLSGPALVELTSTLGWKVIHTAVVPDDQNTISDQLSSWADSLEWIL